MQANTYYINDFKSRLYQLISKADLTYSTPVKRSEEGMPIGNGTMGTLVWTTPTSLKMQLNRVDVFANDASSDNFYERIPIIAEALVLLISTLSGREKVHFQARNLNSTFHVTMD